MLREAADDAVAAAIVDRLADEVVAFARVALDALGLRDAPVEVLLGGGLLRAADRRLLRRDRAGLHAVAPASSVARDRSPPIVGAALLGLDELGRGPGAQARLRASWTAAERGGAADG